MTSITNDGTGKKRSSYVKNSPTSLREDGHGRHGTVQEAQAVRVEPETTPVTDQVSSQAIEAAPEDATLEKLTRIGMVADQLGVSERTLRYYEEVGLLRHIRHSPGTTRLYCEADIARVKRIKELQTLMGFNLEEIQTIISAEDNLESLRDRYSTENPAGQRKIIIEATAILEELRSKVRTKIESLQSFQGALDARIERHHARIDAEKQ